MTPAELSTIEALANAATPGPWRVDAMDMYIHGGDGHMVASRDVPTRQWEVRGYGAEKSGKRPAGSQDANAAFIAAARTAVPALIAEVRRLQAENSAVKGQCRLMLQQREEWSAEPRYSTETVDALVDIVREHLVGLFAAHLQSGADQSLLPAELKELDEALEVVRASREPKP